MRPVPHVGAAAPGPVTPITCDEAPTGANGAALQGFSKADERDCAAAWLAEQISPPPVSDHQQLATVTALLALRGVSLTPTLSGTFVVCRAGRCREVADLGAATAVAAAMRGSK